MKIDMKHHEGAMSGRRTYMKPELIRFGAVKELTLTGSHPQHLENSGQDDENNKLRQRP